MWNTFIRLMFNYFLPHKHLPRRSSGQLLILCHVQTTFYVVVIMLCNTAASRQTLPKNISRFQISLLRGLCQPVNAQLCVLLFIDIKLLKIYDINYTNNTCSITRMEQRGKNFVAKGLLCNLPHCSSNNCLAKITWDSGQPSSASRERNRLREPLGPSINRT